jgi:hypothetical protein
MIVPTLDEESADISIAVEFLLAVCVWKVQNQLPSCISVPLCCSIVTRNWICKLHTGEFTNHLYSVGYYYGQS